MEQNADQATGKEEVSEGPSSEPHSRPRVWVTGGRSGKDTSSTQAQSRQGAHE